MSKTPDQRQATGLVFLQKAAATGGLSEGSARPLV
jgi:hypothetical protein